MPKQSLCSTLPNFMIFKVFIHQVGLKLAPRLHVTERDPNKPIQITWSQ